MMEVLAKGLYPDGKVIIPDYVAGVSSGAISVCAFSAIMEYSQIQTIFTFRTIERNLTNGITWDEYQ
jgi:hypothetical protein